MTEKKKTYKTLLKARFPSAGKREKTAAEQYAEASGDCGILLDLIGQEIAAHAIRAAKEPKNWGYVGDVSHVRETLKNLLTQFIVSRFGSEAEAHRVIEDHINEMKK